MGPFDKPTCSVCGALVPVTERLHCTTCDVTLCERCGPDDSAFCCGDDTGCFDIRYPVVIDDPALDPCSDIDTSRVLQTIRNASLRTKALQARAVDAALHVVLFDMADEPDHHVEFVQPNEDNDT